MNGFQNSKLVAANTAIEQAKEKAARVRLINKLAAHLIAVLHINPGEQSLVYVLSDGKANNNLGAIKLWLDSRLNNENSSETANYWKVELSVLLADIAQS